MKYILILLLFSCTKEQSYEIPDCQSCTKLMIHPSGAVDTLFLNDRFCGEFLVERKQDDGYVMEDGSLIVVECK